MGKIFITKKISDPFLNNVSLLLPFDGSFNDASNNNFTVTTNGNVQISSAQSKFGGSSALFDGNGDYLQLADNNAFELGNSDFTIECWFNLSSNKGYQSIVNKSYNTSDQYGWILYFETNSTLSFLAGNGSWSVILWTSIVPTTNTWHHVAVTRSGNSWKMFYNGNEVVSTTNSINLNTGTLPLYIGRYPYFPSFNSSQDFHGYIDDLRITKGVARYTSNFTPPGPLFNIGKLNISNPVFPIANLLAFWRLEGLTDSSGNGYTLTNNGNVQFVAGKIGNSALGNGENYLTAPVALNLSNQPYTFSFWINLESFNGNGAIVLIGKYPGFSLSVQGPDLLRLDDFTQSASYVSVGAVPLNTWTHLCVTKDASQNVQAYFNGQLDAGTGTTNTSNIANFTLFSAFTFHNYAGRLDALGVWSRVLTINEIKTLYNNGAGLEPFRNGKLNISNQPFPMANLLAFWGFNGNNADASVGDPSYFLTGAGSITYSAGKIGGSINLPQGSRVRIDENLWDAVASPTSYSVAFWVKKNSVSSGGAGAVIAGTIFGPMNFFFTYGYTGEFEESIRYSQVTGNVSYIDIIAPFEVVLGEWVHLASTYNLNDSTVKFYINGTLVGTQTGITPPTSVQHYSWNGFAINGSTIGTDSAEYGGNHSYDGFGLWSRALTSTEVNALYNNGAGVEP
jgi:hypothetical protein